MVREIFIVQNVSTNNVEIQDFGLILPPDGSVDLSNFDQAYLSPEVDNHLITGNLVRIINGLPVSYIDSFYFNVPNVTPFTTYADFYNATNQLLSITTGVYTDIQWNGTRILDGTNYTLLPGNTEIQIDKAGKYLIMARVTVDQIAGNSRSDETHDLQIDTGLGYTIIPGTTGYIYSRQITQGRGGDTMVAVLDVSAGTKIKARGTRNSGAAEFQWPINGCSFTIVSMKGEAGNDGLPGIDSTITIQNNGNTLSSGNSSTINFSGYNIDASFFNGITNIDFAFDNLNSIGIRRTTDFIVTAAWSNVSFDTTDISTGNSIYIDSINTDRIYFQESGAYYVNTIATVTNTTVNTNVWSRFILNGGITSIPSSDAHINNYQGDIHPLFTSFIFYANPGDYITFQSYRDQTAATLLADTTTTIYKLEGIKGDQGDQGIPGIAGSGSSIILTQDGANNFIADKINFIGNIRVTQDLSTGNITIPDISTGLLNDGVLVGKYPNLNFSGNIVNSIEENINTGKININQIYGSAYQLASDLTQTSTTSTTPIVKLTMNTTNLPAGTYRISANWVWQHRSASNDARFDLTLNGTPLGTNATMNMEAKDINSWYPSSRDYYITLSGLNTIEFRYWNEGSTTNISDTIIELIRVQ